VGLGGEPGAKRAKIGGEFQVVGVEQRLSTRISKIDDGVQIALDGNYRYRAGRELKCLSFM